jgi:pyrophosphatase PpaX
VSSGRRWAGVFFDLDGTLADTVELILRSYRHTMQVHLGEVLPDGRWLETIGTPLHLQLGDFARSDEEAGAMLDTYVRFQRSVHDEMVNPFPGAGRVLDVFRRQGARLAVVTSKRSRIARRTLEVCGLWESVDVVVCADQVEHAKPHPESVVRALEDLGLSDRAQDVVFVGDSPFDLRAGKAAGTRTAAALWGPFTKTRLAAESPDFYLDGLEDALEMRPLRPQ